MHTHMRTCRILTLGLQNRGMRTRGHTGASADRVGGTSAKRYGDRHASLSRVQNYRHAVLPTESGLGIV